ncbi:MAG: protein kinase [Acidobacteriota bacterium]
MLVCPVCQTLYDGLNRQRCLYDFTPLEEYKSEESTPKIDDTLLLADRYRILHELGAGGMAVVYLAERIHIGDQAAVKVMNRTVASDPESLTRFEMEARLAASASHPNVVQIYDFGVTKEDLPFLVMEYLEGPTLSQELKKYGTFSLERALEIFQPVCAAVTAAHNAGLIHRDLKPSNIILQQLKGGGEFVKVVDFGIAKTMKGQSHLEGELTSKGTVVGTLGYMSLEQVRGEELDHHSDIYSLGVIFYELLTGQLPFQANNTAQMLVAMAKEQPRSLKGLRPDIPTRIELAVFQALSKNRNERQHSAAEFAQQLVDATVRARPIFVPRHTGDELAKELAIATRANTDNLTAVSRWHGVAGTLNLDCCLGRERELELLKESFLQVAQGQSQPIAIVAEPGVGKSHLILQYQRWLEQESAVVLPARFYDYGGSQLAPYQVFLDTLRACLLGERLPPITQKLDADALKQQTQGSVTAQLAEIIQFKTGITLPGEAFTTEALADTTDKWRVFEAITEIYKRIARSSPLVFLFDDLHFADSLSLELLAYIIRNTAGLRIQVVATALTEAAKIPGQPLRDWFTKQVGQGNYRELMLTGLPRSEAESLLSAIFGHIQITETAIDYLWNETQGYPLYLIELIEHLMVVGKIERTSQGWRCDWIGQLEVPPSVNSLVNTRLRIFSQEALDVFKHASVIGDEFDFDTLARVVGIEEDDLDSILREGILGWVIKETPNALGDFYRFHHSMLRRALYNSMAKANRRRVHTQVAKALEKLHGTKKDRVIGQIAYHYYWGGEWQQAFEPALRAGEIARKRESFNEAVRYFHYGREALEQLQSAAIATNAKLEGKLRTGLAETLILLNKFEEAEGEITRIFELASRQQDLLLRAWGEFLASRLKRSRGDFQRSVELARLGLESIENTSQPDLELHRRLLQQLGYTLWATGQLDAACEPLVKAVELSKAAGDSRPGGWALSFLGLVHCYRGNGTLGLELSENGLRLLRSSSDKVSELYAWERIGIVCSMLGDQDRASYYFESGIELARTIGYKPQQIGLMVNLGEAYRLKGNLPQAEQVYNQALAIARQIEESYVEALCLQNLGLVAITRKQFSEAERLLERALELFHVQNQQNQEAEVYWALGTVLEGLGDKERALVWYQQASTLCQKLSYLDYQWRALLGQANMLVALDRRNEARQAITAAVAIVEQLRKQLPDWANLKLFQEDKQPVYDLLTILETAS